MYPVRRNRRPAGAEIVIPPADLVQALRDRDLVPPAARWISQAGGRTNRVWQVGRGDQSVICKLFGSPGDNPLFPNHPREEFAVLTALHPQRLAPRPLALVACASGTALVYRHLKGRPWRRDPEIVARLLARLHTRRIELPLRRLDSGSVALERQISDISAGLETPLPRPAARSERASVPPVRDAVLIHTDVVANNIIVAPDSARLIDWQCPAMGDPCEDIASFLSPAMQYLYRGEPLTGAEVARFLATYPTREIVHRYHRLRPLFHLRIAAYCAWQAERGEAGYRDAMELELSAGHQTHDQNEQAGQNDANADISDRSE